MKRTAWLWQLFGFAITSLLGTLLHFLYDWTNKSILVAPFSGVNESTWEHMKLLFWPMLVFAIIQSFFFGGYRGFWCIKLRGALLGISLIPIIFYTYNGVIGKSPDWINIAIFFVCAAVVYVYETKQLNEKGDDCKYPCVAFISLVAIALLFVVFTFNTPQIEIFKDPLTASYGIQTNSFR